ncbi:TetR family transcriptional regulator [Microbacterium ulmi]|uniref:TetR family transcriptional regulator n=2 Tax=Microbacterium ulmi TaxID=179095 RepID=A0A7Y2LWV0_9MICO|nr:TetR family transcriptional regulator [Microbacterium ulmi]
MLAELRVNDVSLNELARRAGLAKSNVLRYFASREAILLEIYDEEYGRWLDALEREIARVGDIEGVAEAIARTAAARPILCELAAAAPGVLEQNLSGDVAIAYKRAATAHAVRLGDLVADRLGALPAGARLGLVAAVNLGIGGLWAVTCLSPGMLEAYARHPELDALRPQFEPSLREFVATVLTGLRHRTPRMAGSLDDYEGVLARLVAEDPR